MVCLSFPFPLLIKALLHEAIFLQLATQQLTTGQHGESSCRIHVTRCNFSRNIAKSRKLVYFSCKSPRNFLLRDMLRREGITRAILPPTCLATPLRCKLHKKLPRVTALLVHCRSCIRARSTKTRLSMGCLR